MHRSHKRITIFSGHYGSGKTTAAVSYALWLRGLCPRVTVCDLDIVNPYYRAADWADILCRADIPLISSEYANTNVETPYIPPQAKSVFDDKTLTAVIDAGGDEQGALALGRFASLVNTEDDYEMLMVINRYRPLTRDPQSLVELKRMIESASGIRYTGIVNNSNLGAETTTHDVIASLDYAREAERVLGLRVEMTMARFTATNLAGAPDNLFTIKLLNEMRNDDPCQS